MPYLFSFSGYETNCVIKFLYRLADVITSKIDLESSSKPMVDREKLWGNGKYKNLNILRTKRAFYMKQKPFFQNYLGTIIWWKKEV